MREEMEPVSVPTLRKFTKEDLEDFLDFNLTHGIGNPTPIPDLNLYREYVVKGLIKPKQNSE